MWFLILVEELLKKTLLLFLLPFGFILILVIFVTGLLLCKRDSYPKMVRCVTLWCLAWDGRFFKFSALRTDGVTFYNFASSLWVYNWFHMDYDVIFRKYSNFKKLILQDYILRWIYFCQNQTLEHEILFDSRLDNGIQKELQEKSRIGRKRGVNENGHRLKHILPVCHRHKNTYKW